MKQFKKYSFKNVNSSTIEQDQDYKTLDLGFSKRVKKNMSFLFNDDNSNKLFLCLGYGTLIQPKIINSRINNLQRSIVHKSNGTSGEYILKTTLRQPLAPLISKSLISSEQENSPIRYEQNLSQEQKNDSPSDLNDIIIRKAQAGVDPLCKFKLNSRKLERLRKMISGEEYKIGIFFNKSRMSQFRNKKDSSIS